MSDLEEYGKIAYGEWAAAERRFMRSPEAWENLSLTAQASFIAAGEGVANLVIAGCQWCGDAARRCPDCGMPLTLLHHDPACSQPCGACETAPGEGQWLCIAFLGHLEYTGYVTEITKNGQPAYRIDLPEKVWGGSPLAYVTHAASSWFSDHPVTEESVRKAWEAQQERAARRARQEAEWARGREQRALAAADDSDEDAADEWDERNPF